MRSIGTAFAIATFSILALTSIRVAAQASQPTSPTYNWSAEFVGLDASTRTLTVKARVVGEQALADLPRMKPGDRVDVTWSGFDNYADAIYKDVVARPEAETNQPFLMRAEFVAYEAPRQHVTIKVQVPSVDAVSALKPGEWVTVTARHRVAPEAAAIAAVPYVTSTATEKTT
jgi:hypothetical protein